MSDTDVFLRDGSPVYHRFSNSNHTNQMFYQYHRNNLDIVSSSSKLDETDVDKQLLEVIFVAAYSHR